MPAPAPTAPVPLYRDPEVYERERTAIFARTWQFFGAEADLPRPGDYVSDVLAGYPLLVVRDEVGTLRGFHNLCRHRAGPLVGDARGRCDHALVCRFHGWRYGFDGRLITPCDFGPADGFHTADYSLYAIRVETWRGLVFVNLDLGAAALTEALRPIDEALGAQPRRPARIRDRHPVECNWKVYVENYLDGYRQESLQAVLAPETGNQRQEVRLHGDTALYTPASRDPSAASVWAWAWPNLGLSVYRGVMMVEHIRPQGPDRTLIEHLFLHEPEDPRVEAAILSSESIVEKDAWLSARVQQNLDAGVYTQGVLSPTHESGVAWFHSRVAQALDAGASQA
jgi:choline monooxygenase